MCCVLRKILFEAEVGLLKFFFIICVVEIFFMIFKDFLLFYVFVELENEKLKFLKKMKIEKIKMLVYDLILLKYEDMEIVLFSRKLE